tara:strand:+ start:4528 stop:6105 length:1578 start_codon:yes stop_codon:yes gene_type:complete
MAKGGYVHEDIHRHHTIDRNSTLSLQDVFIGLDIGTTGVKASAFLPDGTLLTSSRSDMVMLSPESGAAEQDCEKYIQTSMQILHDCIKSARAMNGHIVSISLSSIVGSLVALDKHSKPLMNALTWADLRCSADVDRSSGQLDQNKVYKATACQFHSIYTGPKIAWMQRCKPDIYRDAVYLIPTKALIAHYLTGEMVTDRSVASGSGMLNFENASWNSTWLDYLDISPSKLGGVVESDTTIPLLPRIATQLDLHPSTPVIIGASDGPLSTLGVGAIKKGMYTVMIATSAACRTVSSSPILHPELHTWSYYLANGLWVNGGAISSAGIVYRWARDLLFHDESNKLSEAGQDPYLAINSAVGEIKPGADGLMMLPYLAGERSPNWNVDARGLFMGLTLGHDRRHIARAVMEGISLHLGQVMRSLVQIAGSPIEVRTTGGYRSSEDWIQILSNVLNMDLSLPPEGDSSSLGAAMLGMCKAGVFPSLAEAANLVQTSEKVSPNPREVSHYVSMTKKYEAIYRAIAPEFSS